MEENGYSNNNEIFEFNEQKNLPSIDVVEKYTASEDTDQLNELLTGTRRREKKEKTASEMQEEAARFNELKQSRTHPNGKVRNISKFKQDKTSNNHTLTNPDPTNSFWSVEV